MKKHFFTLFLFTLLSACFAQELPVFENDSNASVIDTNMIYSKADTFRFINNTEYDNFRVKVFCYNGTNWNLFGTAEIKMQGDTAYISKIIDTDVKKYRYYAIQLNNMLDESFSFSFFPQMKHHDIYITFTEINNFAEKSALDILGIKKLKSEEKYERTFTFETSITSIKIAKLWVADTYNSAKDVIDMYDEDLNILVGTGAERGFSNLTYSFKITCKKNTVTIRFNNIRSRDSYGYHAVGIGTTGLESLLKKFEVLTISLKGAYDNFDL